jgi:hypothetical protein
MSKKAYKTDEQIMLDAERKIQGRKVRRVFSDFMRTPTKENLKMLLTMVEEFYTSEMNTNVVDDVTTEDVVTTENVA